MLAPSALTRAHALSGNPPSPRSPLVPTRVLCFPRAERRRGGDWPHASVPPARPSPGPAGPFLLPRPTCPRPATLLSVRGHSGASPSPAPPHQLPPRGGSPPCRTLAWRRPGPWPLLPSVHTHCRRDLGASNCSAMAPKSVHSRGPVHPVSARARSCGPDEHKELTCSRRNSVLPEGPLPGASAQRTPSCPRPEMLAAAPSVGLGPDGQWDLTVTCPRCRAAPSSPRPRPSALGPAVRGDAEGGAAVPPPPSSVRVQRDSGRGPRGSWRLAEEAATALHPLGRGSCCPPRSPTPWPALPGAALAPAASRPHQPSRPLRRPPGLFWVCTSRG